MILPKQLFLILIIEKLIIVILLTIFIKNDIVSILNPTKQKFCPLPSQRTGKFIKYINFIVSFNIKVQLSIKKNCKRLNKNSK